MNRITEQQQFNITKKLIDHSAILIVDVESKYVEPSSYWMEDGHKAVMYVKKIEERIQKLASNLSSIQSQFDLYATYETDLHPALHSLPVRHLPYWAGSRNPLPTEMIEVLKKYPQVLVCGLWRERCVFHVTHRLKEEGLVSILLNSRGFTLEASLSGGEDSLREVLARWELNLNEI